MSNISLCYCCAILLFEILCLKLFQKVRKTRNSRCLTSWFLSRTILNTKNPGSFFFFFPSVPLGRVDISLPKFGGWELIGPTWDLIDKMACYVANANKEYNHSDLWDWPNRPNGILSPHRCLSSQTCETTRFQTSGYMTIPSENVSLVRYKKDSSEREDTGSP